MKVPNEDAIAARLLKIPSRFGTEVVYERRTLRIGWRWFLQDFPEGWDKPRDLQAAVEAIVKAAESTNAADGVVPGQLAFEDGAPCPAFDWCIHRGEHQRHEKEQEPPPKPRAPSGERCSDVRHSDMPGGKVYAERCIKKIHAKGRHEYDGGEEVEP